VARILINDNWQMKYAGREYACAVPCSMYDTLIRAGAIPDPYVGENEYSSTPLSDTDTVFERRIRLPEDIRQADRAFLRFDGLDTLAEVFWDGEKLGCADNMHRSWRFSLDGRTGTEEHLLKVVIHSASRYVREQQKKRPLWGVADAMAGYPHLRKAHSTFGWDWGPILPDMGIWRDVSLEGYSGGRILEVQYRQRHEEGAVILSCRAATETWKPGMRTLWSVTAPDGQTQTAELQEGKAEIRIQNPRLWWVRGLGDQPLYRSVVSLMENEREADAKADRIGLRTLTISRKEDEWGQEFCFINNGVKFFAMGANYIPEDQLMPGCTREKTLRTLRDCLAANYNFIRVWGGGYYPGDAFYDFCDEHGIAVWQDCMFACSAYRLTPAFEATVREEIRENAVRLHAHPSLALWCGNNEIESAWVDWGLPEDPEARADYGKLFEGIIPEILRETSPDTFYWPSSPSSGGGFRDPSSNAAGDMHYWSVWHNFKPIEAFRKEHYRFCSEYGFESLPDMKTIRAFAGEQETDLCGPVMEAHQKCSQGTEKLLYYLGQMVNYPTDTERLVYCTQLVQADCIRSNVEHMRRARGRCMGSAYWQVNDSNPVISWSSVDYFGRWKALHYAARKFYAPILLSCDDTDPMAPVLVVTNDTLQDETLQVICRLRDASGRILKTFQTESRTPAMSAEACLSMNLRDALSERAARRSRYLEYSLMKNGEAVSRGTTLFVRPKSFSFRPAHLCWQVEQTEQGPAVTLTSDCFTKSVCLTLKTKDGRFSDNWFDLHGDEAVTVHLLQDDAKECLSAEELERELKVTCYNPMASSEK